MHRHSLILTVIVALSLFGSRSLLAADAAPLIESAKALNAHLAGTLELSNEQIQAHAKTLQDNAEAVAGSKPAIEALIEFVAAYEKKVGTMFIDSPEMSNKAPKAENAIHWAAFWAMQDLLDQVYTNEGLTKYGDLIGKLKFKTADYFPGKVEQPITDEPYTVKINGSYPETWGGPLFMMDRPARKPTGAYLVPGTVATVTVPQSLVGKGYQVRVGAHSWDLEKKRKVNRLFRVSTVYDITGTQVKVANPLGGGIYIEVPYKADAGVVEVTITGASRSPYFSFKPFHKTTNDQWQQVQRNFKSPWADFQSEKFMMQVPTSWVYKLDDPTQLMADWDKAMDIMNDLMGRPHVFGRETLYTQVDTQLRGNAFHPGYPAGNRMYNPTEDYGGYHTHHLVRGPKSAHSYEMHEKGHGFLFPKYAGDREAAVNLPHAAVMNQGFGMSFDEALRSSRSDGNEFRTLETTAIAWMMSEHFLTDGVMQGYERQYQLKGHAKFLDIARLFGWDALGRFWKAGHQAYMDGNPWPQNAGGEEGDVYTINLSKAAVADLRPLIHFWGIPPVNSEKSDAMIKAAGIKPSAKVYDLLVRYKKLIPADNAAFREYALKWWGQQPSEKGYTTERNHAAYWDTYDQAQAKKVRDTMQKIIDRYFPEGRPAE